MKAKVGEGTQIVGAICYGIFFLKSDFGWLDKSYLAFIEWPGPIRRVVEKTQ
jgi:hypothetical protein